MAHQAYHSLLHCNGIDLFLMMTEMMDSTYWTPVVINHICMTAMWAFDQSGHTDKIELVVGSNDDAADDVVECACLR